MVTVVTVAEFTWIATALPDVDTRSRELRVMEMAHPTQTPPDANPMELSDDVSDTRDAASATVQLLVQPAVRRLSSALPLATNLHVDAETATTRSATDPKVRTKRASVPVNDIAVPGVTRNTLLPLVPLLDMSIKANSTELDVDVRVTSPPAMTVLLISEAPVMLNKAAGQTSATLR
jgi:hypothetical protein